MFQIRMYKPQDEKRILELAVQLDVELAVQFKRQPEPKETVSWIQNYLKPFTKYYVLVALDNSDSNIVGFGIGFPFCGMPEVDVLDTKYPSSCFKIHMLFVEKSFRRQRIAKLIVSSFLDFAKQIGYKEIIARVADWNNPSLALFRSLGFQKEKKQTNEFSLKLRD